MHRVSLYLSQPLLGPMYGDNTTRTAQPSLSSPPPTIDIEYEDGTIEETKNVQSPRDMMPVLVNLEY